MSEFTDQLKAQADIVQVIGEFVPLRVIGSRGIGLCPFHGEKTPSFHVHGERKFYYCFGCHASGDIYKFLIETQKISFHEAVAVVAERLGVAVPRLGEGDGDPIRVELLRLHAAAADFFRRTLVGSSGAAGRAYLQARELDEAASEQFHLGFAPDSGRALTQHLQAAGFAPELALRGGLCQPRRESAQAESGAAAWVDLYDRFRGRLVFPIADERGRVIAFGARIIAEAGAERNQPKYLNSPETPVYTKGRVLYNLDRAREPIRKLEQPYFILVEGYLDCIRVFQAGFRNVVASCGTALTPAQVSLLARASRTALINFDPDAAGAAAAERSIGLMLEESFEIRVVRLPDGLDPDLFIRRQGAADYAGALRGARPYFDYLAERARQQFDLRRGEGKLAALNHLLPYLARVHNPLTRQTLADNLATQLQVEQPIIRKELARSVRERRSALGQVNQAAVALLPAERLLLRSWLEWPTLRAELERLLTEEKLLEGLSSAALLARLQELTAAGQDVATLPEQLEGGDRALIAELLLGARQDEPLTETNVNGALDALRERRQGLGVRQQVDRVAAAGQRAELEELLRREHEMRIARHQRGQGG